MEKEPVIVCLFLSPFPSLPKQFINLYIMCEKEPSRTLSPPGPERSLRESTRETGGFTVCVSVSVWTFVLDIHTEPLQLIMCIDGSDIWPTCRSLRLAAKVMATSD